MDGAARCGVDHLVGKAVGVGLQVEGAAVSQHSSHVYVAEQG